MLQTLKATFPTDYAGAYVFPGLRTDARPMSEAAVLAALRSMGFDKDTVTGHGFRATARTLLDEVRGFRPDIIEHQLAHAVKDPNGRAYNRTTHLGERTRMMQEWGDYLDRLRISSTGPSRAALTVTVTTSDSANAKAEHEERRMTETFSLIR